MRVFDEEIRVVQRSEADPQAPSGFVWRGRSYVVREILGSWRTRTSWWRDLLSARPPAMPERAPDHPGQGPAGFATTDLEERVWRVTASAGDVPTGGERVGRVGVYELGHARTWRLLRVSD